MAWQQNYDPLHGPLSTLAAALPLVVLLGLLASRRVPAYAAALAGLTTALLVAVLVIGMPAGLAGRAALFGTAYGLLPIGWIVLNVIFMYRITEARGVFIALQHAITNITATVNTAARYAIGVPTLGCKPLTVNPQMNGPAIAATLADKSIKLKYRPASASGISVSIIGRSAAGTTPKLRPIAKPTTQNPAWVGTRTIATRSRIQIQIVAVNVRLGPMRSTITPAT